MKFSKKPAVVHPFSEALRRKQKDNRICKDSDPEFP